MIPILRPADVKAIDERALAGETLPQILERVGSVVADQAVEMLGTSRGKTVVALVGPGLNGADARAAAARLRENGVTVIEVDAVNLPSSLPRADLIIDGAFGIGLSRPWTAPRVGSVPVLAIDIPSGIEGVGGAALGSPLKARRTITLGGYKAGLLFGDGPDYCGEVVVGDIGLGGNDVRSRLVEAVDVGRWIPERSRRAHKWKHALLAVAGAPGMPGAARLCTAAAMRAGAGYVHLVTLADDDPGLEAEVVRSPGLSGLPDFSRFGAAVLGPGLGTSAEAANVVKGVIGNFAGPLVIDGDGLTLAAPDLRLIQGRTVPAVLTPHDGEYRRLWGLPPVGDRIAAAQDLAAQSKAVVLLKGPATVIASPDGDVRVCNIGDQRLATAGTGDVLAGLIGALLTQGARPFDAATAGAYIHGTAAMLGPRIGLVASDLVGLIPAAIETLMIDR